MHDDVIIILKIHHQASFAQNYSHHLDIQYCLHVGFGYKFDLARANIDKFLFSNLRLGGEFKIASQTSSHIRAIKCLVQQANFAFQKIRQNWT